MKYLLVALFYGCALSATPVYDRYPSGWMRGYAADEPRNEGRQERSVSSFIQREFSELPRGAEWVADAQWEDATHSHHIYSLRYRGRRVAEQGLKIHFARRGWVQYASSSLEGNLRFEAPSRKHRIERAKLIEEWEEVYRRRYPGARFRVSAEPIYWVHDGLGVPAVDLRAVVFGPHAFRHAIVEEATGKVLAELPARRKQNARVSNFVFLSNPGQAAATSQTLPTLTAPETRLLNSYLHVWREENTTSPTTIEVDPSQNFSAAGAFITHPTTLANYGFTCTGTSADCPNQGFDAVNVYFHLSKYREAVDANLATLQATSAVAALLSDPVQVIVNAIVDQTGFGDYEVNNAFYTPTACLDSSPNPCIVFDPPGTPSSGSCASRTFYDVAREANVGVHEYQHYITDRIARLKLGYTGAHIVADALHEGYSDYFAASHIYELSGGAGAKIAEYAFQDCSVAVRNVAVLRVYQNGTDEEDPHTSGLSWASALWALRTEYGKSVMDLIALKSLFFLPTNPSFFDAVEALARADQALYDGAHVGRIRRLLYEDIRWVGGKSGIFRDTENKVVELGLRSCAAVHGRGAGGLTGLCMLFWLGLTVWVGRRAQRRLAV